MTDTGPQNFALEPSPAGPPDEGRRRLVAERIRLIPANHLIDDLADLSAGQV
jgi:hypothetical protein